MGAGIALRSAVCCAVSGVIGTGTLAADPDVVGAGCAAVAAYCDLVTTPDAEGAGCALIADGAAGLGCAGFPALAAAALATASKEHIGFHW